MAWTFFLLWETWKLIAHLLGVGVAQLHVFHSAFATEYSTTSSSRHIWEQRQDLCLWAYLLVYLRTIPWISHHMILETLQTCKASVYQLWIIKSSSSKPYSCWMLLEPNKLLSSGLLVGSEKIMRCKSLISEHKLKREPHACTWAHWPVCMYLYWCD